MVDLGTSPYTGRKITKRIVINKRKGTVTTTTRSGQRTVTRVGNPKRVISRSKVSSGSGTVEVKPKSSTTDNAVTQVKAKTEPIKSSSSPSPKLGFSSRDFYDVPTQTSLVRNQIPTRTQEGKIDYVGYAYQQAISRPKDLPLQRTSRSRDAPFFSVRGQKQRFVRAGQSIEWAGRNVANVFVKGQPFTDQPAQLTAQDKFGKFITSPAFVFGAPAVVAAASIPAVSAAGSRLASTQAGRFAVSGTKAVAGGVGLTAAGKRIGEKSLSKPQERLFEDPRVQQAYYQARQEAPGRQRQRASQSFISGVTRVAGSVRQRGFKPKAIEASRGLSQIGISGVQFIGATVSEEVTAFGRASGTSEFKDVFSQRLTEQGFSPSQIRTAQKGAKKKLLAEDVGQLSGVIFAGREAEAFGRTGTAGVKAGQTFGTTFAKTAGVIGQAGVFEGAAIELSAQKQLGKEFDPKRVAGAAAIGGVTAGVLGGTVAGLSATKKGKALQGALYALDPSEPLGDFTQDVFEKGIRKGVTSKVLTPTIPTQPTMPSYIFSESGSVTTQQTPVSEIEGLRDSFRVRGGGRRKGRAPSIITPSTPISLPTTPTIPTTPTVPVSPTPTIPVSPTIPVPVSPTIPVSPTPTIPVQPTVPVPAQINPFTQVQTNIFTPQPLGIPLGLPFLPGGGGGSGAASRLRKVSQPKDYVSSLGASVLGITGGKTQAGVLTGLGIRPLVGRKRKPKKKSSKKRKRR